jgi:DNA polymerase-3 subunit beta
MAATDLELAVLASTPAVTTEATETLVLPARKLLAILREVPDGDVTVEVAGDSATIRAGTARWSFVLDNATSYPPLPDPAQVEMRAVSRPAFLGALKTVRHAVGRDSGRPPLMQVDIAVAADGTAKVTASDGVRFARTNLVSFPFSAKIPSGALDSLVKTLDGSELEEVQAGQTGSHLVFRIGASVYMASKMLAKFPDVDKLLLRPALENKFLLAVDKADLTSAIRRVRINADPDTLAIGLQVDDGALTVLARDKYRSHAQETVTALWRDREGPAGKSLPGRLVVVSHQFLTDMLGAYPVASCRFWLGPEAGKKRSVLMLRDDESGTTEVIFQMTASQVGYGDQA